MGQVLVLPLSVRVSIVGLGSFDVVIQGAPGAERDVGASAQRPVEEDAQGSYPTRRWTAAGGAAGAGGRGGGEETVPGPGGGAGEERLATAARLRAQVSAERRQFALLEGERAGRRLRLKPSAAAATAPIRPAGPPVKF
jgi:hypothetical protein